MRTMHKFEQPFSSFSSSPTSLGNLTRRLDLQVRAAVQAQDDLNEARRLAGLPPVEAFVVVGETVKPRHRARRPRLLILPRRSLLRIERRAAWSRSRSRPRAA